MSRGARVLSREGRGAGRDARGIGAAPGMIIASVGGTYGRDDPKPVSAGTEGRMPVDEPGMPNVVSVPGVA